MQEFELTTKSEKQSYANLLVAVCERSNIEVFSPCRADETIFTKQYSIPLLFLITRRGGAFALWSLYHNMLFFWPHPWIKYWESCVSLCVKNGPEMLFANLKDFVCRFIRVFGFSFHAKTDQTMINTFLPLNQKSNIFSVTMSLISFTFVNLMLMVMRIWVFSCSFFIWCKISHGI